jgi:hypothetical protein
MTEYSKLAQVDFTATGTSAVINLPFQPDYVELWNYTNIKTAAANSVTRAWWNNKLIDPVLNSNPTMIELYSGSTTSVVFDIISNTSANPGINTFAAGQLLQYGPVFQVVSITKANPAVVEVTAHGLQSGDVVVFQGLYSTQFTAGMPQIDGIPFTVTVTDANHFTIPWNTNQSNYTALAASPSGATMKKVLYPYLYFPGVTFISNITLGATTIVDTTTAHNYVVGQEVAFRMPRVVQVPALSPPAWGVFEINSLPNTIIPGSPIYGYVVAVTDYNTFVVNINSTSFTAFNSNIPVADVPGLSFPQVVAVGDVNTGGELITITSQLYPPPHTLIFGTTQFVDTINGPAIRGAFVNNTSQGITIGSGLAAVDGVATLIQEGDIIKIHAYLHDYNRP